MVSLVYPNNDEVRNSIQTHQIVVYVSTQLSARLWKIPAVYIFNGDIRFRVGKSFR